MVVMRPVGESVALPRMRRARHPKTPELADVFGRLEEGLRRRVRPGVQELARERGVGPDVGPGRPCLERGRDHDVVGTGNDVVPACRVEMMAPVNAGALRKGGHAIKYAGPEGPRKGS